MSRFLLRLWLCVVLLCVSPCLLGGETEETRLPGTEPLEWQGDIAARMVAGVDQFLLAEIEKSVARRARHWNRDYSSAESYKKSIEPNRKRLAHILGVRDRRAAFDALSCQATSEHSGPIAVGEGYEIHSVRWPVLAFPGPTWPGEASIYGEGLLLVPVGDRPPVADIVAIPDADQTPEQIAGLVEGVPVERQFARRLAEHGARVVVPVLVDRSLSKRDGRALLTNREYVYRSAFELGRHLIGYEVQKVLSCVDWFSRQAGDGDAQIGVAGYGEGAMIALYAAALDTRIDSTLISGYVDNRNTIWRQPIDRNVFGLLDQFGDAELLTMVFPRSLVIETGRGPTVDLPSQGGAPATLHPADAEAVEHEIERAERILKPATFPANAWNVIRARDDAGFFDQTLSRLLDYVGADYKPAELTNTLPRVVGHLPDAAARQNRQVGQIDRHNQWLLRESPYVRAEFMEKLDTSSLNAYERTVAPYREYFRDEVIGRFDYEPLPPNVRSRKTYDEEKWTGYEVVLDVFPDVFAYGILLLPKDLKPGEQRPVVVCQHGLEGRPQHLIGEEGHGAYKAFAARLAERGFITFAPQNPYIFGDRFRILQRKANPLGKTLFSIIVPQHQQIVDWLKTLPQVDPERIAFYGLSYGGKTAMRVPALVTDYCLSICSADFNEWVWKNASTRSPYSYVWTGEYEIFEFDLGSTFNYAEMAALIAPRPFMVERGHFDGVAPDETVAYEFAKVRHLYAARLGIADRCRIEWFPGPHTINGQGTFEFLHEWLGWPGTSR